MKKRRLSLLLALVMIMTMLPVRVWAEEVSPMQDRGEVSSPVSEEGVITGSDDSKPTVLENMLSVSFETLAGSSAVTTKTSYVLEDGRTTTVDAVPVDMLPIDSSGDVPITTLPTGWYVVNSNVTRGSLTVNGDVKLILADDCTLTSNGGVRVTKTDSLSIYGQANGTGRMTATGYRDSAGIGGSYMEDGGTVNIYGGTVTATGGNYGSGIGGGTGGNGGTVNIRGGTVSATGGQCGSGIGGGSAAGGGTVNIYGGTVTATGNESAAGIGGGGWGNGGTVNIWGGRVTATGNDRGAGIGGGVGCNGGTVSIYGGTVTATSIKMLSGGGEGADIGGGYTSSGTSTCKITGGSVLADFNKSYSPTPTDGVNDLTLLTLGGVTPATPIQSLTVSGANYGVNGMETDAGGKLYLWLPDGAKVSQVRTADKVYTWNEGSDGLVPDTTLPTVVTVEPFGTGKTINGDLVITFNEKMRSGKGEVALNDRLLTGGAWNSDNTVFTIPYSRLYTGTEYTINISAFEDYSGNSMASDSSHTFTTAASSNANLRDLTVGSSTVSGFNPGTFIYDVELPYGTKPSTQAATVRATAADAKATVVITQADTLPGSATVEVTPEDGLTSKTYTIIFTIAASSNANLSDLTVGGSTVSGFDPWTLSYKVVLPYDTEAGTQAATVGATAADTKATVVITQAATLPGSATVEVTPEDGSTPKTYIITFTLGEAPKSSEKDVIGVIIPSGAILKGTSITGSVANNITSQLVKLSVSQNASWKLYSDTGCTIELANQTMTLLEGTNTAYIRVTAQDGSTKDYTLTIIRKGRSSSGSTSSSDLSNIKASIPTEKQPGMPTTAKMSLSGTVKDGVLSTTITKEMVKDAIEAAQDAARKAEKTEDGIATVFMITGSSSYTSLKVMMDGEAIDLLKEAGVKFIKVGSSVMDIHFDTEAIAEMDRQSTGTVTVWAKAQPKLSEAAKALIGSRPVFDITVSYEKNGQTENITSFGKGVVTLGIAYKIASEEKTEHLFGVYVDKDGKPQLLTQSSYEEGRVTFTRSTLSIYGVGYKTPALVFTDTTNHWAKQSIDFVTSRGLMDGTSTKTFSPNTATTRGDFLMALGRLYGVDVSGYQMSSFTDVMNSDPAMGYIEWAVKNKIVQGYGSGKFGPNQSISRQDMAVMMQHYAKATSYQLPVSNVAVTFSDYTKIHSYAQEAVTAIQQAGIMQGKGNNTFDPTGKVTRGEASAILQRFVEFVIEEGKELNWD